jgi:hypothetical protein
VAFCDSNKNENLSKNSKANINDSEAIYQVASMLKPGLHDKTRSFIGETSEGLRRFRMYQEYSSSGFKDGGFVKVGSIDIKDSADNVCMLWQDAENRQDWDKVSVN